MCPWGLGLFSERGILCPPLSPSHPTQLMRCVTHVRFWVFGSREVGDGGKQLSSSWEAKQYPSGDTLESLPMEPQLAGMFISHLELFLRHLPHPAPRLRCASVVSSTERARDLPSARRKKDTCVPKWWFYFFSFYVCMGNCG